MFVVAIIGAGTASVWNDLAKLESADGKGAATVRSCISREGVHLNRVVWQAASGRRIRHAYSYLGYDVEPSCDNKE